MSAVMAGVETPTVAMLVGLNASLMSPYTNLSAETPLESLLDVLKGANLTTYIELIEKAGLTSKYSADSVDSITANSTVFAPTDEAFAQRSEEVC